MTESTFEQKFNTVKTENDNLRNYIEQVHAEKEAALQTINELLSANLNFKAGTKLLETKITRLDAVIAGKDKELEDLHKKLQDNLHVVTEDETDVA